jgi:hypothetical protein
MTHKLLKSSLFVLGLLLSFTAHSQDSLTNYSKQINGVYHYYHSGKMNEHYLFILQTDTLLFINLEKSDTFFYSAKWTANNILTTTYISGEGHVKRKELKKVKKNEVLYKIVGNTDDYILFQTYHGTISKKAAIDDTLWLSEKSGIKFNALYQQVFNENEIKLSNFSDTSNYALVYIYRPGKFTNHLADIPIFFNGQSVFAAKNKSGYLFKIYKEGDLNIMSKIFADKSAVNLKIKTGKVYYVKAMIHWTAASKFLYNFNLEMAIMDNQKGETEMKEVKFKKE